MTCAKFKAFHLTLLTLHQVRSLRPAATYMLGRADSSNLQKARPGVHKLLMGAQAFFFSLLMTFLYQSLRRLGYVISIRSINNFIYVLIYCLQEMHGATIKSDLFSLLHFCKQLYMFWMLTPIIRSSYSCNYSFSQCCCGHHQVGYNLSETVRGHVSDVETHHQELVQL